MITLEKGALEVVLPPGKYLIGDPCYHVPEEQWDRVLAESGFFAMGGMGAGPNEQCWATFETFDSRTGTVVAFDTLYGDGTYTDGTGNEYGVDAGLLGIIPLGDVDPAEVDEKLARIVEFKTPVVCYQDRGMITFGGITIDTNDDNGAEDHDDEDYSDTEDDE